MNNKILNKIGQYWIMIFGCSAMWFLGRTEDWSRWGYIFGLIGQPAWFYSSITNKQYGILMLSIWYTYCWGQGIYNFWLN